MHFHNSFSMRIKEFQQQLLKRLYKMFEKDTKDDSKATSIQDIAIKVAAEQKLLETNATEAKERTIFMLGSKGVGKSTVINKFFERDENPRTTLALEYSYGRRTGSSSAGGAGTQKQVLNVWELGSLANAAQLIEVPMRTHGLEHFAAIIMLDLAQPQRIWTDLECAYKGLRETAAKLLQSTPAQSQLLQERAVERVKAAQAELGSLELLPFPVVIVGGKYDVFMDFEPALKKHICRCLRAMSHLIGAALLFYSYKIPKLSKTLRDTVSHLGFGSPANPFRTHTTDYNDALAIWFGTDSWSRIGEDCGTTSVERIGATLDIEVPQLQPEKQKQLTDPAKDPGFKEPIIDDMRAQKNEELEAFMRDAQMRGKFESVAG